MTPTDFAAKTVTSTDRFALKHGALSDSLAAAGGNVFVCRESSRRVGTRLARVLLVMVLTITSDASADEPKDLISRAHAAARARGATARAPLKAEQATLDGEKVLRLQFELKANACLVAAAAAPESVNDAEVSLKAPGADWIADTSPGPVATLRYCAGKVAERVQLRARVPGQEASIALGAWPMRAVDEAAGEKALEAGAPDAKNNPTLLRRELAKLAAQHAASLEAAAPAREEDFGPGDPRTREVSLEAGRCYRFLAVAGAPISHLSLRLRDPAGKELAAHSADARSIALPRGAPFCALTTAAYQLTVEAKGLAGVALWQPFGGPDPAREQRFAVGGESNDQLSKRIRDAHAALPNDATPAMSFAAGTLATAQRAEATFEVQPGTCYDAMAAGMPSLRSLDLEIVDQRDNVIAEVRDQGSFALAHACASIPGTWRVRARAFKGYGRYGLQVFGSP
jgi:hypothetical protein